jgi:hypothetical protein
MEHEDIQFDKAELEAAFDRYVDRLKGRAGEEAMSDEDCFCEDGCVLLGKHDVCFVSDSQVVAGCAEAHLRALDTVRRVGQRAGSAGLDGHLQTLQEAEAALRSALSAFRGQATVVEPLACPSCRQWIAANAPGGWIDDLRKRAAPLNADE